MEKISAACALCWSIELEKGLRSRKPGCCIESILQIGRRLNQWNIEPQITMGMCTMFGLVPGEDQLLVDAILFRLADAFVSGDKDTRILIIKAFLSHLRHRRTKGETCRIFSNMNAETRLELLRRVNEVLCVDCVRSRASVFILFGCWAEFAKDIAEIRDVVLSSLTSRHVLEVRASLFTAGCFSESSDDFGYVFLERLLALMTSQNTLPTLKIAGARSFAKFGCSLLQVTRTHKAGAELLQKILEEDVVAAMLISLTKLSLKTAILISEQIGLLCSFLCQTTSPNMQATVLRCIRRIGEKSASFVPPGAFPFQSLFRMLDEPSTPAALRCEILQILFKMIANGLPEMLLKDIEELMELLRYVENATRSPFLSERVLAFEILVCISTKLKGRIETISVCDSVKFSSGVATSILDQITVLVNRLSGGTFSSEVGNELRKMLRLLLVLAKDYSELGYFILDRLHLVIGNFVKSHMPAPELQKSEVHKVVSAGAKGNIFPSRVLMLHVHNFLVAFLGSLDEVGGTTEQVVSKLKQLIFLISGSNLFDCSIHTFFSLIWHSHINQGRVSSESKTSSTCVQGLGSFSSTLLGYESAIYMCADNMLAGGDNWCAYRAGRYAVCEGAWNLANFIFHQLETRAQSDFCCQWLKFLSQITKFEKTIKVLLLQACFCLPSDHIEPCAVEDSRRTTIRTEYLEQLVGACNDISCSDKVLEAISVQTQAFFFQRWLLALRLKVLHVLVDMLKVLDKFLFCKDTVESIRHPGETEVFCGDPLLSRIKDANTSLVGLSSKLLSLSEEFDLVASSFIDMDDRSLKTITNLALSCSLLAFCTEFSNSITFRYLSTTPGDCHSATIKDLIGRLWHVDSETCMKLLSLLKDNELHERLVLPKFRPSTVGCISDELLTVCRGSVKTMIELHEQSLTMQNEDGVLQVNKDGMHFLLKVVETWIHIPLRIPAYFFKLRRSIGSLLFWSGAGAEKQELFVSPGSHLALNLCIQLKDVPSDLCSRFSKLHCILYCRKSSSATGSRGEPCVESGAIYRAAETDTMIHLNKKLQCYVMKQSREFISCRDPRDAGEAVEAYVTFETSGRTQGFSTCLMNVSTFPVGSYQIYWHSGGIDNHGAYHSLLPLCPGPLFTVR